MSEDMSEDMGAALVVDDGSKVLIERACDMLGDGGLIDAIWQNMSFHVATVRLREVNPDIPIGPTAQCYIGLVLATYESLRAAEKMAEAAKVSRTEADT